MRRSIRITRRNRRTRHPRRQTRRTCHTRRTSIHRRQRKNGSAYPPRMNGESSNNHRNRSLKNIKERNDLYEAIAFMDPEVVKDILQRNSSPPSFNGSEESKNSPLAMGSEDVMSPLLYVIHIVTDTMIAENQATGLVGIDEEEKERVLSILKDIKAHGGKLNRIEPNGRTTYENMIQLLSEYGSVNKNQPIDEIKQWIINHKP